MNIVMIEINEKNQIGETLHLLCSDVRHHSFKKELDFLTSIGGDKTENPSILTLEVPFTEKGYDMIGIGDTLLLTLSRIPDPNPTN